jgi:hypothetical protein
VFTAFFISLAAVGAFAASLHLTSIGDVSRRIMQHTSQGIAAMTDKELDDDEKEVLVRRSGIALFVGSWSIFWCFGVSLIAAFIPIYLADAFNLVNDSDVIGLMLRLDYIVLSVLRLLHSFGWQSESALQIRLRAQPPIIRANA